MLLKVFPFQWHFLGYDQSSSMQIGNYFFRSRLSAATTPTKTANKTK
jgi:hypothetical protein